MVLSTFDTGMISMQLIPRSAKYGSCAIVPSMSLPNSLIISS